MEPRVFWIWKLVLLSQIATIYVQHFSPHFFAEAGCQDRKLCCPGRNLTCIAANDGKLPDRPRQTGSQTTENPLENAVPNGEPRPHVHESVKSFAEEKKFPFVPSWHIHTEDLNPDLPRLKKFFDTLHSRRHSSRTKQQLSQLRVPKKKIAGDDVKVVKENSAPPKKESNPDASEIVKIFGEEGFITEKNPKKISDKHLQEIDSGQTSEFPEIDTNSEKLDVDPAIDIGSGEFVIDYKEFTPIDDGVLEEPEVSINDDNTTILFKDPTSALKYKTYFGKVYQGQPLEEQVVYLGDDPVIRYTILNELVPITMEQQLGFLKMKDACYCDEECMKLGDCCTDYTSVCPAQNCEVSDWTGWGHCGSENALEATEHERRQHCGSGVQRRERRILSEPAHAGELCPHLTENRVCFSSCETIQSEVALLLQYKFGAARTPGSQNNIYYDLPKAVAKWESMESYCVIFETKWINPRCKERDIREDLRPGSRVCLECQPTAQLGKGDRCTGEGLENQKTFWSMVGKNQCNGMWVRKEVKAPCSCTDAFLTTPAYIFV